MGTNFCDYNRDFYKKTEFRRFERWCKGNAGAGRDKRKSSQMESDCLGFGDPRGAAEYRCN